MRAPGTAGARVLLPSVGAAVLHLAKMVTECQAQRWVLGIPW